MPRYDFQLRPPDYFMRRLKQIASGLDACYDSASNRWDILYSAPADGLNYHVYRICQRDAKGRDIGFVSLQDEDVQQFVLGKLLRMDLQRRDIAPKEYVRKVGQNDEADVARSHKAIADETQRIMRDERRTMAHAYEAYRSVSRT